MAFVPLAADVQQAAMEKGKPDLKWILSDQEVPETIQGVLFEAGVTKASTFMGLGEDRAEVKATLKEDFKLDAAANIQTRISVAKLLTAWEMTKVHCTKENEAAAEARAGQITRAITTSEHSAMVKAFNKRFDADLRREQVPSPTYLGLKQEDIQEDNPRAEKLYEVTSGEDHTEEFLTTMMDSSGNIKVKKGNKDGKMPKDPEELRAKIKLMGAAWCFLRIRFGKDWLSDMVPSVWERYAEFLLGPTVAKVRTEVESDGAKSHLHVPWTIILGYEYELRRFACEQVIQHRVTLAEALKQACTNTFVRDVHFVTHLTLSHKRPFSIQNKGDKGNGGKAKSSGKGKKGTDKGKNGGKSDQVNPQKLKRMLGKQQICFKFNKSTESCDGQCGRAHVCQWCLSSAHGQHNCPKHK